MKLFAALTAALCFASPFAALAQQQDQTTRDPVVVELFTSQGCSSCPPADALLHQLAQRPDVLALALHVDYWDYIGWKDTFASPAHTRRQKGYAHVGGRKMIYTPQMIVMGHQDISGADGMGIADAIKKHQVEPRPVALDLQRSGNRLTISVSPRSPLGELPVSIQIVRYTPKETVEITRGELRGHRLDYANIVRDVEQVGVWDGRGNMQVTVDLDTEAETAVLVQQAPFGPILAAARVAK